MRTNISVYKIRMDDATYQLLEDLIWRATRTVSREIYPYPADPNDEQGRFHAEMARLHFEQALDNALLGWEGETVAVSSIGAPALGQLIYALITRPELQEWVWKGYDGPKQIITGQAGRRLMSLIGDATGPGASKTWL